MNGRQGARRQAKTTREPCAKDEEMANQQTAAFILGAKKLARKGCRSMAEEMGKWVKTRAKKACCVAASLCVLVALCAATQVGVGLFAQSRLLATDTALSLVPLVFGDSLDRVVDDVSKASRAGSQGGQFALFCLRGRHSATEVCEKLALGFIDNKESGFVRESPDFIADFGFRSNAEWTALLKDSSLTQTWARSAKIASNESEASVERALDDALFGARRTLSPRTRAEWISAAVAGALNMVMGALFFAGLAIVAFPLGLVFWWVGGATRAKTKKLVALAIEEGQGEALAKRERLILSSEAQISSHKKPARSSAKRL